MKKVNGFLIVLVMVWTAISCGGKKEEASTAAKEDYGTPQEEVAATKSDPIAQGESLVKANDCKTCHDKTNKIIGPSHTDVAKKYDFTDANVKKLAEKIIKGGSGNWGQVPMTAHPNVSESDAELMAKYVLSLDGEKEH
ncbi:MAG: cytochrome c class I [Bacteroidetes bacterium]|nr:cytochrome c class I [Bacteroidota bacterium]MBS1541791.1 cytochrome c class I [Bacteroidota bacterium]